MPIIGVYTKSFTKCVFSDMIVYDSIFFLNKLFES